MTRIDKERDEKIMSLLETYNTAEIGEMLGISRERVRQIVNNRLGGYPDSYRKWQRRVQRKVDKSLIGTMPDLTIAKMCGVSVTTISRIRNGMGIPKFRKPLGCDRCISEPYAKGLCKPCYMRMWRNTKNESR